jgi:hypothetical protein
MMSRMESGLMIEAMLYIAVLPVLAFLMGIIVVEIVDRSRNV